MAEKAKKAKKKKLKNFRVQAEVISYCYIIVKAESAEHANELAEGIEAGDFVSDTTGGDFNILNTLTQETKEKTT